MSFFQIDKEKCVHDGVCVDECPVGILEMKDDSLVPTPVEGAEKFCIGCGHCVAVCPYGAFSLDGMKTEDCPPVRKDLALGVDHVEHFLRSRRSIRTYRDKAIEHEKLDKLLDIVSYAPTASNSQQVKWLAINSREKVQSMAGLVIDYMRHMIEEKHPMTQKYNLPRFIKAWEDGTDLVSRGAPALIVAHAPKDYSLGLTDSAIAVTFLDVAAPSFGLGSCWGGHFMMTVSQCPHLQHAFALPEGHACFGAIMLGYPKYEYHRLPLRKKADIIWR